MKSQLPWQTPWKAEIPNWAGNSPEAREAAKRQAERFWQSQRDILDNFEKLTQSWLERRRSGTAESLSAATKLCDCKDAGEVGQIYTDWMTQSVDRWINDGRALNKHALLTLQQFTAVLEGLRESAVAEADAVKADTAQAEAATKAAAKPAAFSQKSPSGRHQAAE